MRVDVRIAQCALQLTNDECQLLVLRRQVNRKLADVRRQRRALVEGVVALDEKARQAEAGGGIHADDTVYRNIRARFADVKRKSKKGGAK